MVDLFILSKKGECFYGLFEGEKTLQLVIGQNKGGLSIMTKHVE